ncbi:hypothetical protein JCM10207_005439 [Rhodosporidiobolus poonsookiae]
MSTPSKRMDWHSMMYTDYDEGKKPDSTTSLGLDTSDKHQPTGLPEIAPVPTVMFDYKEAGDEPHHLTDSVWHNAMMHVDGHLDAEHTYDSMPHWTWVDDVDH